MNRILVVVKEHSIPNTIDRIVGDRYEVLVTENGNDAISMLKESDDFCAIISAAKTQDMPGIDFLEKAKYIAPRIPRILLTDYIDADLLAAAINRASVYHFLKKPVDSKHLVALMDECAESLARSKPITPEAAKGEDIADVLKSVNPADEFTMLYQPRVCAVTGRTKSVEALIRWHSPVLGQVSPATFIPIAEKSGDITWITEWVLFTASQAWAEWRDADGNPMPVSVNISPSLFSQDRLIDTVARAIKASGITPNCLELEITEGLELTERSAVAATIAGIKDLGVRLSLDDFGTGLASVNYLQSLHVDTLKVNRSFVSNATSSPSDGAILRTVQQMGRCLGVKTVAEGIEDLEHANFVRSLGYDEMQGFHFSKPVAAPDLISWMGNRPAGAA